MCFACWGCMTILNFVSTFLLASCFVPPHSTTHIFSPSVKKYVTANFIDVCIILQKQTSPFDIFHNLFNNKKQSPRYAFCYYKNRDRQNLGSMGKSASPLMTWVPSKLSRKGFLTEFWIDFNYCTFWVTLLELVLLHKIINF